MDVENHLHLEWRDLGFGFFILNGGHLGGESLKKPVVYVGGRNVSVAG